MKFEEIIATHSLAQLAETSIDNAEIVDEAKMSTSVFDKFIASSDADDMQAGFEAELIFSGLGSAKSESEPDYDYDRRPRSIDDIIDFFDDGDFNGNRQLSRLRGALESEFFDWQSDKLSDDWSASEGDAVREYIENNDWNEEDELREHMDSEMGLTDDAIDEAMRWLGARAQSVTSSTTQRELIKTDQSYANFIEASDAVGELLDERVQESIDNGDRNYDNAREQWEDDNRDNYEDSDWLRSSDYDNMSDVENSYSISWPYYTAGVEGGFNEDNALQLARDLSATLDVRTKVASGYHSTARKPGLWIFEPDSSLVPDEGDDMPVEIISPPLPLRECLEILPKFFEWAKSNDAYANGSTGFHMGVSLPTVGGRVDYVKLALFLGDEYVLEEFERGSNYFAKSSMKKLRAEAQAGSITTEQVADTLKLMRNNLIELADKTIKRGAGVHGKYTSINMKQDYIEFRSAGGASYFNEPASLEKVLSTLKRYAYAMYVASRPDMYRDEYAKKLYKLLDKEGNNAVAMQQFAYYVARVGGADAQTVKDFITNTQSASYSDAPLPDRSTPVRSGAKNSSGKYWWRVEMGRSGNSIKVVATNKNEAKVIAAREWGVPPEMAGNWAITRLKPFEDSPGGAGNFKLMIDGQQVFRLAAATQAQANAMVREWLATRSPEFRQEHAGREIEVVPVAN